MRYPKIIDELYGGKITVVQLVLTIPNPIDFVKRKHRKKRVKSFVVSLVICSLLLLILILFVASHRTYYKYNDWLILDSNINIVRQKYGEFDLGIVTDNQAGKVAYYIYTDNGPIMPDHLKHYYYMEYDEWGVIYKVYDACQPGG